MSGGRQIPQVPGPGPLLITKRRYTITELYRLRETLRFLSCPLENFSPEAFQYLIVTPHIPASAHIDPQTRQKILQTLVKIDKERMASAPVKKVLPPHLRMRQAAPAAAPITLEPITPLTVVYGNVVGNETAQEPEPVTIKRGPETTQLVDKATAEAWWAGLSGEQKIGIAEPYILEGCEIPTASVHKACLNPAVPSFTIGALGEVVPNAPVAVAKQGKSPLAAKQDDWSTSAPTKADDWDVSPIQTSTSEWGSSSTPPVRATTASVKATAASAKEDDWNISTTIPTKQDDWNISTTTPTKQDDWNISTTTPTKQDDWNIISSPKQQDDLSTTFQPTAQISKTLENEERLIPPHKPAWIGLRSNGEEQDEFIRFMTAKVFPRIIQSIPKKPALDTTYVTENPDPAPADDFGVAASNSLSSDW